MNSPMPAISRRSQLSVLLWLTLSCLVCPSSARANSAWLPEVEQLYRADVYGSEAAAAGYLWRAVHEDARAQGKSLRLNAADAKWQAKLAEFLSVDPAASEESVDVLFSRQRRADGRHTITLQVPDWGWSRDAAFVEKPWLAAKPGQGLVPVFGLAADDFEGAADDVRSQAMEQVLVPQVRQHLRHPRWLSSRAQRYTQRRLAQAWDESDLVRDRFRQTFYTSIDGEEHVALVREAVLLDLGEGQVEHLARPIARDLRRVRHGSTTAFGFAGTVLLSTLIICRLGYGFINRWTQGYYVWPLRCVTAAVLLATAGLTATLTMTFLNSL